MRKFFMILLILVFIPVFASAESIPFAWIANPPEENVDGYKMYDVTVSGEEMIQVLDIQGGDITSVVYEETDESKCHYYVLTAYRGNVQSDPTSPPLEWCPANTITIPEITVQGKPTTTIQFQLNFNQ